VNVHVALVSAYPDETTARAGLTADGYTDLGAYRGIWRAPQPYGGVAHLFADCDQNEIEQAGWTREDA
jgi:hypothetical protein